MPSLTGGNEETLTLRVIVEGINEANRKLDSIDQKIGGTATKMGGIGDILKTSVAFAIGTILVDALKTAWEWAQKIVGALEDLIGDAIEFEAQMTRVQIAAGLLEDGTAVGTQNFEDLSAAALELGKDVDIVGVSAADASKGLEILYKAGFNQYEIFGPDGLQGTAQGTSEAYGIFKAAADLAAISQLDLNEATEFSVAILNTFGSALEETGDPIVDAQTKTDFLNESMDTLVRVANVSVADVEDFQGALKNVGPTAAGLGYSLEEVAIAIGVMSDRGISAEEAGTALRRMLANVNRDTKKVNETLDQLGVSLFDEQGNLRDLSSVFQDFAGALSSEYEPTLVSVTKATAEQTALYNEATDVYDKMTEAIDLHNAGLKILSDSTLERYISQQQAANQVIQDYQAIGTEQIEIDKAMTEEQRARIVQTVAGVYGQNAFNALISDGGMAMADLSEKTENATSFQERFTAILGTSSAQIEKITSFWETFKLEIGTGFLTAIGKVLGAFADWLDETDAVDKISATLVETIEWLTGVIGDKLFDIIQNLPEYIQTATEWWNKFKDGLKTGGNWIQDHVVPILDKLKEWFDLIVPIVKDMAETYIQGYLIPAFQQIWKVIQEDILPWVERLVDILNEYVPVAIEYLSKIWESTLKPALETVFKFIKDFVIPFIGKLANIILSVVVPALEKWVAYLISDIIPALSDMWDWIGENVIPVLDDFVNWLIENVLPALDDLGVYITDTVIPAISDLWEWIQDSVIPAIIDFKDRVVEAYEKFIEWKDKIVEFIEEALASLQEWWEEKIIPIIEKLVEIYNEKLVPAFEAVKSFIQDSLIPALQDMWAFIQDNVVPVWDAFVDVINEIIGLIGDIGTKIGEFVDAALTTLYNWFNDNIIPIWEDFVELLEEKVQPIIETISDYINDTVIPAIEDFFDKVVELKDDVVELIEKGLDKLREILEEKIMPIFNTVRDFIRDHLISFFEKLRDNAVVSLTEKVDILRSSLGWLRDLLVDVKEKIQGFREKLQGVEIPDALQEHSPPPLVQALMDTKTVMDAITTQSIPAMAGAFASLSNPFAAGVSSITNNTTSSVNNQYFNLETYTTLGPGQLGLEFQEMQLTSR